MIPRLHIHVWNFFLIFCFVYLCPIQATTWSFPVSFAQANGDDHFPQIVVDPNGNATVVWIQLGEKDNQVSIQSATKPWGLEWTSPVLLATVVVEEECYPRPQIVVDSAGNITAIWAYFDGIKSVIQATTKSFGGEWSPAVQVSQEGMNNHPHLAVDPTGNVTAVWENQGCGIQSSFLSFGGSWSEPLTISSPHSFMPQVGVDMNGNAIAIWQHLQGDNYIIQAATRLGEGKWCFPDYLGTSVGTVLQPTPKLVVDPAGNAVAVWVQLLPSSRDQYSVIQSSMKRVGEEWLPMTITSHLTGPIGDPSPQVAIDAKGNAVVIWSQFEGTSQSTIQTANKLFDGYWSSPAILSVGGIFNIHPQLAVDSSGNIVAVWTQENEGNETVVQSARLPLEGKWSETRAISSSQQGMRHAQVAVDLAGNAWVIWEQREGMQSEMRSAELLACANVHGLEPRTGTIHKSTVVTITGVNFTHATAVHFGTSPAISFVVNSDTSITAIAPPRVLGMVNVTVTTPLGTSYPTSMNQFTYELLPPVMILPPIYVAVVQRKDEFLHRRDVVNVVTWQPPVEGERPVAYKIYRDKELTKLLAEIPAHKPLIFEDHQRCSNQPSVYFLVSIDQMRNVSRPTHVALHPKSWRR